MLIIIYVKKNIVHFKFLVRISIGA